MNIIWLDKDKKVKVTFLAGDTDPQEWAHTIKERGDIDPDWEAVAFNIQVPAIDNNYGNWTWNGTQIITGT